MPLHCIFTALFSLKKSKDSHFGLSTKIHISNLFSMKLSDVLFVG